MRYTEKLMLNWEEFYFAAPSGWWQPNPSRTIFYYDFEDSNNRLADTSWNNNDATSATYITYSQESWQYVAETTNTSWWIDIPGSYWSTIGTWDFAMSCWVYIENPWSRAYPCLFAVRYDWWNANSCIWFDPNNTISDSYPSWSWVKREFLDGAVCYKWTIDPTTLYNWWHNFVMTRNNWTVTCYIDTNIDISFTETWTFPNAWNWCLLSRPTTWAPQSFPAWAKWDKFILENVWRSQQNVTDYFNQTKSLYGIS